MNFVKWFGHAHRHVVSYGAMYLIAREYVVPEVIIIDGMSHELVKVSEDETTSAILCRSIYRINGVTYEARPRQNRKEGK
jgi:hypothetical protein